MKRAKAKTCKKSTAQHNTFSMIKFYESIPNYDEIGHLPEYDFTERMHLLKKVHYDLSKPASAPRIASAKRPKSRSKSKKCAKTKKTTSKTRNGTPSTCESSKNPTITESEETTPSSASQNSFDIEARPFCSIREKILADIEEYDRRFDDLTPSPALHINDNYLRSSVPIPPYEPPPFHHHQHHHHRHHQHQHCDPNRLCPSTAQNFDGLGHHMKSPRISIDNMTTAVPRKETNHDVKSPINYSPLPSNLKRSKSCPKDLFSCTNEEPLKPKPAKSCIRRLIRSNNNASPGCISQPAMSVCRKRNDTKPKIPHAIDEFLTSKMVRSNLAANLRQQWSRQKITEMTNRRIESPSTVERTTKYIPKCHRWDVRETPAWKTFQLEDTTTEKFLRENARREESTLRHHAHAMHMNMMRSRVKSAQLLLEGRSLTAK